MSHFIFNTYVQFHFSLLLVKIVWANLCEVRIKSIFYHWKLLEQFHFKIFKCGISYHKKIRLKSTWTKRKKSFATLHSIEYGSDFIWWFKDMVFSFADNYIKVTTSHRNGYFLSYLRWWHCETFKMCHFSL